MNNAITTLILFGCIACNQDCDLDVNGLCVVTNDYPVNTELIQWELNTVESIINRSYYGLNLADLIAIYSVKLNAVEEGSIDHNRRGQYNFDSKEIDVNYITEGDTRALCLEFYYVFGHELLHFIADTYLNIDYESNSKHNIPGVFLDPTIPAFSKGSLPSIEQDIFVDTYYHCKELYE